MIYLKQVAGKFILTKNGISTVYENIALAFENIENIEN